MLHIIRAGRVCACVSYSPHNMCLFPRSACVRVCTCVFSIVNDPYRTREWIVHQSIHKSTAALIELQLSVCFMCVCGLYRKIYGANTWKLLTTHMRAPPENRYKIQENARGNNYAANS